MSRPQIWTTIGLSFVLILTLILAVFVYKSYSIPPTFSEFSIEGEFIIETDSYSSVIINKISGRTDNRIIDWLISTLEEDAQR
ncbi:hypothetical protein LCGC14_1127680 [marine sediment metagenome]|uniref:Uncharacterized protein n=1 Tax=marine sediment metagenome TaxID=412755 RepID=A0A0F9MPU5_9ZZZZ